MNEQNLPKNTKKEVKETAVPVVSNDPQEVNNDSPPKLKGGYRLQRKDKFQ